MKQKLKDPSRVPHGGLYQLNLPERGMVGSGTCLYQLKDSITAYRKANSIPTGLGFPDELEEAVCQQYPQECKGELPTNTPRPGKFDWQDVVRGSMVMLKQKLGGIPLVNDAEANRRAAICAKCPWKSEVQMPCSARICGELQTIVERVVGARTTTSDSQITRKCCAVCGCFLTASVYVDLELQWSVLSEEQKAQFRVVGENYPCWKQGV